MRKGSLWRIAGCILAPLTLVFMIVVADMRPAEAAKDQKCNRSHNRCTFSCGVHGASPNGTCMPRCDLALLNCYETTDRGGKGKGKGGKAAKAPEPVRPKNPAPKNKTVYDLPKTSPYSVGARVKNQRK